MKQKEIENEDAPPPAVVELPICCQLIRELPVGLFRVLRAKGKTLSSGGFGISVSDDVPETRQDQENGNDRKCEAVEKEVPSHDSTPAMESEEVGDASGLESEAAESASKPNAPELKKKQTLQYLFVEEVVFLFERGLLECLDTNSASLSSSQLYQLLPEMGISLPMYFVYAHLRSQDFRVLRYSPDRLSLLRRQQENGLTKLEFSGLKRAVRESVRVAAIPKIPENGLSICWDAYKPNTQFAKTHPGIPDFYVSVTYYGRPQASFCAIHNLLWEKCDGVPLKLAMVSDSGAVVMFGVSPDGVPVMTNKKEG
jgi:hypothetical protein